MLINLIIYIIVPRHDKDTETLSKALYYSKKAYEEALAAKESSIRTENVINEFIKTVSSRNDNNENSNGELKGKKKHFWYTVSVMFYVDYFKKFHF